MSVSHTRSGADGPAAGAGAGDGDTMSLLRRIVDDAVDPGYALAVPSARKAGSRVPRHVALATALLLLGALITATIVQVRAGAPGVERARTDLLAQVETETDATDALARDIESTRLSVTELQASTLRATEEGRRLEAQLTDLGVATGVVALEGPGVTVMLDDGPPSRSEPGQPDLARVLDRDLQVAVNGLFAAGAEAVSVNGQRITALSPIRSAGSAVLVGYRPLTPPYTVTALGDPRTLATTFSRSPDGRALQALAQTYGIRFDVATSDALTVPAVDSVTLRYARTEGE